MHKENPSADKFKEVKGGPDANVEMVVVFGGKKINLILCVDIEEEMIVFW